MEARLVDVRLLYDVGDRAHEVPRADGKGTRPTSLRDARKIDTAAPLL